MSCNKTCRRTALPAAVLTQVACFRDSTGDDADDERCGAAAFAATAPHMPLAFPPSTSLTPQSTPGNSARRQGTGFSTADNVLKEGPILLASARSARRSLPLLQNLPYKLCKLCMWSTVPFGRHRPPMPRMAPHATPPASNSTTVLRTTPTCSPV